jgi:P21-Rho-binding domain
MAETPSRVDSGFGKSRHRLSDEFKLASQSKKKIFGLFKSSNSSSGRRPTISAPSNATHLTHVGIDGETGKLVVRARLISRNGFPLRLLSPQWRFQSASSGRSIH